MTSALSRYLLVMSLVCIAAAPLAGQKRIIAHEDVFLMKLDMRGNLEWVRAVGSVWAESAPRVTVEGGSVTLVGMTKGEMDCGSGPLQRWSSDTFFLCIFGGVDGAAVSGGVFPTGTP